MIGGNPSRPVNAGRRVMTTISPGGRQAGKSEKYLLGKCLLHLKDLRRQGVKVKGRKVHGGSFQSGEPDLDIVLRGRAVKIELKAPGKKPTARQEHVLREWSEAGAVAVWLDNFEAFRQLLAELSKEPFFDGT